MSRRFSPFFSIFRVLLCLLLLHLLGELSAADSWLTSKQIYCMHKKMEEEAKKTYTFQYSFAKDGGAIKSCSRQTDSSLMRNRYMDPMYHNWEKDQMDFEMTTDYMMKKQKKSYDDAEFQNMTSTNEYSRKRRENCLKAKQTAQCDKNAKYRTADGQCNNLRNPTYGSIKCCQDRLLPAYYEGSSGFRTSVQGGPLPSPRELSLTLHHHVNLPTYQWTHMFVFFGQFLDHDITLTPTSTTVNNQAIQCCPPKENTHPQCKPIIVKKDDPFYGKYNVTCINFVRSAVCNTCSFGYRQQGEQVTSFADLSVVYGNSDKEMDALQKKDGSGKLKYQPSEDGDLLPRSDPKGDRCSVPEKNQYCFKAGDSRVNQHTILTAIQTVFLREHNRMAEKLHKLNPHWDDERLFQEARHILGAIFQKIVYSEYLPIVLGGNTMNYYKLNVGSTTKYDPQVKSCMITEFTTACFRFGHSLINSVIADYQFRGTKQSPLLRNSYLKPFPLYYGTTGALLRGACYSKPQQFDQWLVDDVTNYLYRAHGAKFGLDLAAFNIQRGRDHGLPPYVEMVKYCSKGKIRILSFYDLERYSLMKHEQVEYLMNNYKHVRDVDMWPAILMEGPYKGGVVGFTASCVIVEQFRRLKFGDRFYWEHDKYFSTEQKKEISNVRLSDIICMNTNASSLPKNCMLFPSANNPEISCKDVRPMNLKLWQEKRY